MEIIKLKIDLSAMIFEFEGSAAFAREALAEFLAARPHKAKTHVTVDAESLRQDGGTDQSGEVSEESSSKGKKSKRKTNRNTKDSYSIPKDLDLSGRGAGIESLEDFFNEKKPANAQEMNAVFVYYLERKLELTAVTPDHVYACYKQAKAKLPTRLRQSLLDTSSRKSWIDTSKMDNLKVAVPGENFVEHYLPKKDRSPT